MKQRVSMKEAREQIEQIILAVSEGGDEILIEDEGKPGVAVISAERYRALERNRERLWQFVQKAQAGNERLSESEVSALVTQEIADARQERAARATQ